MKTLDDIIRDFPTLNSIGFNGKDGKKLNTYADGILTAAHWAQDTQLKTKISQHSTFNNIPKTAFEYSTGSYVPRGAMLAALIMAGFPFKQQDEWAYVGVSTRTLALALETGGIPLDVLNRGPYAALQDAGYEFAMSNFSKRHDREKALTVLKGGQPCLEHPSPDFYFVGRKGPRTLEQFHREAGIGYGKQTVMGKLLAGWAKELLYKPKAYLRYYAR